MKTSEIELTFDTGNADSYRQFLQVRKLPIYRFHGSAALIPREYGRLLGISTQSEPVPYVPSPWLFDYQAAIARLAIMRKKFAIFADCGLGKTLMMLEFARHAFQTTKKRVLFVTPLMVVPQIMDEALRFYGDSMPIESVAAKDLPSWLTGGTGIAVTNYEAIKDELPSSELGGMILDESSYLKSTGGAWGTRLIEMGRGVEFKLCGTGTPAPNDRVEYANHAVFLDAFKTQNSFFATFFVNKGNKEDKWQLKPHGVRPFYKSLASWSIFLTNPATYGWKDNVGTLPPINVHIDHVELTDDQRDKAQRVTGSLFFGSSGGFTTQGKLSQIAKGKGTESLKPAFIRDQINSWIDEESTIVWCHYNEEQDELAKLLPRSASIDGQTSYEKRLEIINKFKSGEVRTLITKPKVLGFGLNLQVCTRQVFSGLNNSYESYYQAVKRSNRIGSTRPLNVHIPVTELEVPFVNNVLKKASRVEHDAREQEALFKEIGHEFLFAS